jgi:hypothetical protein
MIAQADYAESVWRMTNGRGCNNQEPSTEKQQRLAAVAGNKSKRTVAEDGWRKGAVAINESIDARATATARDDESRQRRTEQTENNKAGVDATTNH